MDSKTLEYVNIFSREFVHTHILCATVQYQRSRDLEVPLEAVIEGG